VEGKFIVIEGADGTGKSTQAEMLVKHLESKGLPVVAVREPGGTAVGERVRAVLRDPALAGMSAEAEMFLYMASRAQLVREVVKPALAEGKIVVADRFLLSTVVYQGAAGGLGEETVKRIGEAATGGLSPDIIVIIDVKEKKWLSRKGLQRDGAQINIFDEPPDREELKGIEFHKKVRNAYLELARKDKSKVVIDGGGTPQQVHHRVVEAVENALQ
jgi:dTMP kinase